MPATPDSTLAGVRRSNADLQRENAELRRSLDERTAERDARTQERDEALQRETATAEVLQVINSSPGDPAPVFDAILEKALHLCEASFGQLVIYDGVGFQAAAWRGYTPEPSRPGKTTAPAPGMALHRLIQGEVVIHVADIRADEVYRSGNRVRRRLADEFGGRTAIWVALQQAATLLGAFVIYRTTVHPFTDKQIALLQNFAAQAVIAMENARLITETREALEQQTATAELLGVINSSPGDLAPVFDAMLERATKLCNPAFGMMYLFDGELFHPGAMRGVPVAAAEYSRKSLRPTVSGGPLEKLIQGEHIVHIPELMDEGYRSGAANRRALVDLCGARSAVWVALRKGTLLRGVMEIFRQERREFSNKEIALLQNFAGQAVIAMENARLITETREALEQQTATAEVLGVINSSPGDLAPVFDAMLERAMRLIGAAFGIANTYDGKQFRTAALQRVPPALAELWSSAPPEPGPNSALTRLASGEDVVHIEDCARTSRCLCGRTGSSLAQ
jgi:GAF domain-containing protein